MTWLSACLAVAAVSLSACWPGGGAYTLYRSSPLDPLMRVHLATFDSADGSAYNQENCILAASLFAAQPGVTVRFWCEQGRFHE